jgi:pyruvate formate lyase activating enzyme
MIAISAPPMRRVAPSLVVGGLTPLSTTDYPDHLSAVVFCQGCPWRCGYCHNPHLLPAKRSGQIAWNDVLSFLDRRRGLLDAVVFSGGEPLAQSGLADAMRAARSLGFKIGLHTGGAYPKRLAEVLPLVDWVGFDIKARFAEYRRITAVRGSGDRALASAMLVLGSDVSELGVRNYVLQEFRADGCVDTTLVKNLPMSFLTESWSAAIAPKFTSFTVRRA